MKTIVTVCVCILCGPVLVAAAGDAEKRIGQCLSVGNSQQRLECYDRAAREVANAATDAVSIPASGKWRLLRIDLRDGLRISGPGSSSPIVLALEADTPIRAWPEIVFAPILIVGCKFADSNYNQVAIYTNTQFASEAGSNTYVSFVVGFDKDTPVSIALLQRPDYRGAHFLRDKDYAALIEGRGSMTIAFKPFNTALVLAHFTLTGFKDSFQRFKEECSGIELAAIRGADSKKEEESRRLAELKEYQTRVEVPGKVFVVMDDAVLRAAPDRFDSLSKIPQGVEVTFIVRKGNWFQVRLSTGDTGWLLAEKLKPK